MQQHLARRRALSRAATAALLSLALAAAAHAADRVKVGFVSTLSGPSSALGIDIRDGFMLAIKLHGGKLGGLPAEVLVSDDQFDLVRKVQKIEDVVANDLIPEWLA